MLSWPELSTRWVRWKKRKRRCTYCFVVFHSLPFLLVLLPLDFPPTQIPVFLQRSLTFHPSFPWGLQVRTNVSHAVCQKKLIIGQVGSYLCDCNQGDGGVPRHGTRLLVWRTAEQHSSAARFAQQEINIPLQWEVKKSFLNHSVHWYHS